MFDFDVLIERPKPISKVQNVGVLTIYEDRVKPIFDCLSVELGWHDNKRQISCIKSGYYKVKKRYTTKRGYHWELLNVENRSYILIHDKVNYVGSMNPKTGHSDVLGCIIPAFKMIDLNKDGIKDIAPKSSTEALSAINNIMTKLKLDEFTLKIV